jgi:pimeloyl-ACP methyl ester carboxylesterase
VSPRAASIFYTLAGDSRAAPPLILLHGAAGSRLSWPPNLRRLPGFPVYTLDLPGHGRSPGPAPQNIPDFAQAVADFLQARALPPAVLVGHSMGSAIALTLALTHPQRVRALILIGGGARLRVHPSLLEWTAQPERLEQAIQTLLEWGFGPQCPAPIKTLAAQSMRQTPAATFHADFLACDRFDLRQELPHISQPTLLLCGTEDRMTPVRFSEYLAASLPHARLILLEGAGHMLMLERPQEVEQAILEFLRTL